MRIRPGLALIFLISLTTGLSASAETCVRGGVVDVVGTKKMLKIFQGTYPDETFIVLGNEKFKLLDSVSNIVTGELDLTDADGKPTELKRIAIYTDAKSVADAKEGIANDIKAKKTEQYELPCPPETNAVFFATDSKNGLRRYVSRGMCFKMVTLSEEESLQERLQTENADGTLNSVGALLLPQSTRGSVEGSEGSRVDLDFIVGISQPPRYYKGGAHFNGRIHLESPSGGCPAGDYFVTGTGTWTGAGDDTPEHRVGRYQQRLVDARGPAKLSFDAGSSVRMQLSADGKQKSYSFADGFKVSCPAGDTASAR